MNQDTKKDLYREVANLCRRTQARGATFFRYNAKTLVSLDRDTICPKAEEGNACRYCYRHDLQKAKRLKDTVYHTGPLTKTVRDALIYGLRELAMVLHKYGIKRSEFSIRTFSLSDFRYKDRDFWRAVWRTCRETEFKVHAITKQLPYVPFIASNVDGVQVSVDTNDVNHRRRAYTLRGNYKNVVVRGVELSEVDRWLRRFVDIVTIYHGNHVEGLKTYRTNHASHKTLCGKSQEECGTGAHVCCATGTCIDCRKCWPIQQ